jgi:hypothetical protein
MLYAFFWVISRRLNFICRRFGTLYLFRLYRQVGMKERKAGSPTAGILRVELRKLPDHSSIYVTPFLNIRHIIPQYTSRHSSIYVTPFLNIRHTIPEYTSHHSSIYVTPFLNIRHTIPQYTSHHFSIYVTRFLNIRHTIPQYTSHHSSLYVTPFLNIRHTQNSLSCCMKLFGYQRTRNNLALKGHATIWLSKDTQQFGSQRTCSNLALKGHATICLSKDTQQFHVVSFQTFCCSAWF